MTDQALNSLRIALNAYRLADARGTVAEAIRAYNRLCDLCFDAGCPIDHDEPAGWALLKVICADIRQAA